MLNRTKIICALILCLLAAPVQALDHSKPEMRDGEYYREYWEQHFLFDDGSFLSSRFAVANFPWPVGKDHGILVATFVTPDGRRKIIKNGRDLGEWGFDPDVFDLFIHRHRIKTEGGRHRVALRDDDDSEIIAVGTRESAPLDHERYNGGEGVMESSIYLPYFSGEGSWKLRRPGQDGFEGSGGTFQGFGTHVLIDGPLPEQLKSWFRMSGLKGASDGQSAPFLSAIERPDGTQDVILTLKNADGEVTVFSDVLVNLKDFKKADKGSSFPQVIEVSSFRKKTGVNGVMLTGTIRLTRKIDHFNINDHLNVFEKGFADTRSSITNYRYIAEYDLTYVSPEGTQKLTGTALSEYADVLPPEKEKTKRLRRRR